MHKKGNAKIYPAFTLLEMLLVIAILMVLGTMGVQSFGGLQSSVSLNEESLGLSQDIRNLQRSAMLLEREVDEGWLYGLGIDFSEYETTGKYKVFKWCSPYSGYGSIKTRGVLPEFDDEYSIAPDNGYLPDYDAAKDSCYVEDGTFTSFLVEWSTGSPTITDTGLNPKLNTGVRYILFESVSGRAFLYDSARTPLINYTSSGELKSDPVDLVIQLNTKQTTKTITVKNLSGRILIDAQANE